MRQTYSDAHEAVGSRASISCFSDFHQMWLGEIGRHWHPMLNVLDTAFGYKKNDNMAIY